jgi:hypothetical protein
MMSLKFRPALKTRFDTQRAVKKVLRAWEAPVSGEENSTLLAVKIMDALLEHDGDGTTALFVGTFPEPSANALRVLRTAALYWTPLEDEDRDLRWFHEEIEANPKYAGLDAEMIVQQWAVFLEHNFRRKVAKLPNKMPEIWKRSLLNFFKISLDRFRQAREKPDHVESIPIPPRRR